MQNAPGEKTIMAYFSSSGAAQKAAQEIKNAGYKETQVDRISRYGATSNGEYDNPINNAATISGPTLFSSGSPPDATDSERVLMAADSSANGYGDTGYGVSGNKAFLLTVVTSEDKASRVRQIVEDNGGIL